MITSNQDPRATSASVLVAGAGPAGLTTAITLARDGIDVVLVERRPALSGLPRAASVSTRTMEVWRSWGLEDRIRAGGVDVEWKQWVGSTLAAAGETQSMSFPTREQSAVLSPTAPASVPQDHVETVLLGHLRSLTSARVELGVEVVGIDSESQGVVAARHRSRDGVHFALAHGVPLVVAGDTEDKPEVAARVAWSGTGIDLSTGRPSSTAVRRAVRRVLDTPGYRLAAAAVAAQIEAARGVDELVDAITALANRSSGDVAGV